jgi:hypothetical protein
MTPDRADELARISKALVAAIGEAKARLDAQEVYDSDFADLVQHARELHTLMCEALLEAEPDVDERARGLADAIGNNLDQIESALRGPPN